MQPDRSTERRAYADRLIRVQQSWWKRIIDVQAPYRWNLRRLRPGYTLEIGCGIGRNLEHLRGHAVGIDHNPDSVEFAKRRGFVAFLPEEFQVSPYNRAEHYDSLLLAHVVEHMTHKEAAHLIGIYVPNLRPHGKLILIAPQEAGFRSDSTHVEFMDFEKLREIYLALGMTAETAFSFPFPRILGDIFTYNEFVCVGHKAKQGPSV